VKRGEREYSGAPPLTVAGRKLDDATMATRSHFASPADYVARSNDVELWRPYAEAILERHGLATSGQDLEAGVGGTFPTFLSGQYVVKLFGGWPTWAQSFRTERAAYQLLRTVEVSAPKLLADGALFDAPDAPWPFLLTTRRSGSPWHDTPLSHDQRLSIAAALGRQMRVVHRLPASGIPAHEDCERVDLLEGAKNSSFPAHLVAQIGDYVARASPFDRVMVHSDLTPRHVFVDGGTLTGIIDWGDALVTDRHYELAKLHLDLFGCDKSLLRTFLEASDWPVTENFHHQALALSLYRQAHGLVQHRSMDVFYKLPERFRLQDFRSLPELATALFTI
jgi:hygromycin-B 7''-O-kinase